MKDLNYLLHRNAGKWYEIQIYFYVSYKDFDKARVNTFVNA